MRVLESTRGLKVGAGTVVLNQQSNEEGSTQAFSSVNIAGGTSSVILGNERQINPDSVSWGYRGGKLDLNGTSATFHKLKAADYGAVLANDDNENISTITLDYQLKPRDITTHEWDSSNRGTVGDLYEYNNTYTRTTDYFILKKSKYGYFPTTQISDDNWEYLGHELDAAQKLIAKRTNDKSYVFHGRLEGNMNVENRVSSEYGGALVLDGSANIKGTFTQDNGHWFYRDILSSMHLIPSKQLNIYQRKATILYTHSQRLSSRKIGKTETLRLVNSF